MADAGAVMIGVVAGSNALACVAVLLRFWSRFLIPKRMWAEDVLILLALMASITYTTFTEYARRRGLGKHDVDVDPDHYAIIGFCLWVNLIVYSFALTLIKIAILMQMLPYFFRRYQRFALYTFIASVAAFGAWSVTFPMYICTPIQGTWDDSIESDCGNYAVGWFVAAGWSILTDIIITILPIPMLEPLQLPAVQKYGLILVFALGGVTAIISPLRIPALVNFVQGVDIAWTDKDWTVWLGVEMNIAMVCACLPTIRPVLKLAFPQYFNSQGTQRKVNQHRNDSAVNENSNMVDRPNRLKNAWTSFSETIKSTSRAETSVVYPTVTRDISIVEHV